MRRDRPYASAASPSSDRATPPRTPSATSPCWSTAIRKPRSPGLSDATNLGRCSGASRTTSCPNVAGSAPTPSGSSTPVSSSSSAGSAPSASRTGPTAATLVAADGRQAGPFDRIVNATGFRPDLAMLSELRVDVDPVLQSARTLAPMIDPNVHSCGSVPPHGAAELAHPEPGFYIVGAKSYGRAPTFLLATGYEQVRSVVAELAGDRAAADDVQLILPETGVCSLDRSTDRATARVADPLDLITVPDAAVACCADPAIVGWGSSALAPGDPHPGDRAVGVVGRAVLRLRRRRTGDHRVTPGGPTASSPAPSRLGLLIAGFGAPPIATRARSVRSAARAHHGIARRDDRDARLRRRAEHRRAVPGLDRDRRRHGRNPVRACDGGARRTRPRPPTSHPRGPHRCRRPRQHRLRSARGMARRGRSAGARRSPCSASAVGCSPPFSTASCCPPAHAHSAATQVAHLPAPPVDRSSAAAAERGPLRAGRDDRHHRLPDRFARRTAALISRWPRRRSA